MHIFCGQVLEQNCQFGPVCITCPGRSPKPRWQPPIAYDGIKALTPLSAEIVKKTWRTEWKTFIALQLRTQGSRDDQQGMQIPLSKTMMSLTHCRVPDDCLRCFEIKFQAVRKWTESTL
jgi:hypothetical protein